MVEAGLVAEEDRVVRGLAATSERLTDAALITTAEPDPRIVFANAAFVRLSGRPAEALSQRGLSMLQGPAEFEAGLARLRSTIVATGSFFMDVTLRRDDGETLVVEWQATPVVDERGPGRYLFSIVRDVTSRHREWLPAARKREGGGRRGGVPVVREDPDTEGAARARSGRDRLTGLIDRGKFERRLVKAASSAKQSGRSQVLLHIDLDHFKQINEAAGRAAGDAVLRQVASLLRARFRERDTLARLGGDSFGILLDNCGLEEAEKIAETIVASFASTRFPVPGRHEALTVSPSIGLVEVSSAAGTAEQLLSQADLACYTAKELGRGRSHIYRSDRQTVETAPVVLFPQEFRSALEQDRFQLYYQPILPLQEGSGLPIHYEFLLRHRTDGGQLVLPSTLIEAAERHGLMAAVDRWVIRAALTHLVGHRQRFGQGTIAINLSGNSLDDPGVVDYVVAQLAAHGIEPRMVCFEITETEAIRDLVHAAKVARGLKQLGCAIALDDFGSGQSSFTYLKALPADYLKIDGSFVRHLTESPVDRSIVSAINATGRIMGLKTIAEFAHSDAILDCLRDLGVDYAQGDAVAPPRPVPPLGSAAEGEPLAPPHSPPSADPKPRP